MSTPRQKDVSLGHLYRSVRKRYSLLRCYENDFVRELSLDGVGIDLGAKSHDAKYYAYMEMSRVGRLDFVDYFHSGPGIIQADLEQPLPIEDCQYDFILAFNVIEHLFETERFLSESFRVLRVGGRFHGFAPLLVRYHPDPNDYFRFTSQALQKLMEATGFIDIRIEPICFGPFKVGVSQVAGFLRFWPVRFFAYTLAMGLDRLLIRFSKKGAESFALTYYFSGRRPSLGGFEPRNQSM